MAISAGGFRQMLRPRQDDGSKPPPEVEARIKRGRDRMQEGAPYRNECLSFWRGDQYTYVNSEKYLVKQSTVTNQDGTGKPPQRIRRAYNLIAPVVANKVSQATSRTPGYEISPSTVDPEDAGAARISQKVAFYGYDEWQVRKATVDAVTYALVADEGFAWPFFDTSIGPFVKDGEGGTVGQGDVRIRRFGPNEVFWEPGVRFDESSWHAVEQARSLDEIRGMEGFTGVPLTADAAGSSTPTSHERQKGLANAKLAMVTDYLERPSRQSPKGRWVTLANGREVVPPRAYPCVDQDGRVLDEPVLHKLSFIQDPDSDRDMGLVRFLLDPQRTFNQANSKQLEWMTLALNPQVIVINGKLAQKLNDVPGAVFNYFGSGDVRWREVPAMPSELGAIKQDAQQVIQLIAADNQIPQNVEAARTVQALIERDEQVWQSFYAGLADFHSRLMRHCLYLVQRHYTEERLLMIRGEWGVEPLRDFLGAQLRGQANVTVLPGSLEPRTKAQIEQRVMNYAQLGWISKEAAMSAVNNGSAETLVDDYEKDVAFARRIIQRIKEGPQALFGQVDPTTGVAAPAPDYMPKPYHKVPVIKAVFESFMKTEEFEGLPPDMREATEQFYGGCLDLEAQQQARQMQAQAAEAEQYGMQNASKPRVKPNPSFPDLQNNQPAEQPGR